MEFKLLEGDVLEMCKEIENESVDCIVTSPPYNIGKDYGSNVNDKKSKDDYLFWIRDICIVMQADYEGRCSLFINIGYTNLDPLDYNGCSASNPKRPRITE
jgi:site-specific DNA-methyltransferase (adenine-specific)